MGLAVLVATYLVVRIVRFVLEIGLLPRVRLKQGIAFAISAVVRYVLITGGVLLAMAAMGIDLTKVTLLAGALGVGIGLGLQGVVNNFVSGLILLVERPIGAGDSVQIGDVQGVVRKIGVRSTNILTSHGDEIIVPNAELISKSVTNWTLADRRRKLDIDVSVARGTDPRIDHPRAGGHCGHDRRRRGRAVTARMAHRASRQLFRLSAASLGRRHRPCACRSKRAANRDRTQVPGCHDPGRVGQTIQC